MSLLPAEEVGNQQVAAATNGNSPATVRSFSWNCLYSTAHVAAQGASGWLSGGWAQRISPARMRRPVSFHSQDKIRNVSD